MLALSYSLRWRSERQEDNREGRTELPTQSASAMLRRLHWQHKHIYAVSGRHVTTVSKMIDLSHIHLIIKGNQLQEKKYRGHRVSRGRLVSSSSLTSVHVKHVRTHTHTHTHTHVEWKSGRTE